MHIEMAKFHCVSYWDIALLMVVSSSVAFGMRKALMSEQGKLDMEEDISSLRTEKRDLEQQVSEREGL